MGLFDGNKVAEAAALLARQEALLEEKMSRIEALVEERDRLRTQVDKLQESLFAVKSPQAYVQMKADEASLNWQPDPVNAEFEEKKRLEREALEGFIDVQEQPLFWDADDMIDKLRRMGGVPEAEPLHDNSES